MSQACSCLKTGKFSVFFSSMIYSTGHRYHSTHTHINCVQYGRFPRKIHAKNSRVNFTRALTHRLFTCKFECILTVTDFAYKLHASYVYFFTTANVADVKLETDIVEKQDLKRKPFLGR